MKFPNLFSLRQINRPAWLQLDHRKLGPAEMRRLSQGVANINFRYERIFEYIYIQKTIRTNIRINSYQKDDTNEYIRIKKAIQMNIRIYLYQKNDTNMIRTNIHIGKYSNIRIHSYQIFDVGC